MKTNIQGCVTVCMYTCIHMRQVTVVLVLHHSWLVLEKEKHSGYNSKKVVTSVTTFFFLSPGTLPGGGHVEVEFEYEHERVVNPLFVLVV